MKLITTFVLALLLFLPSVLRPQLRELTPQATLHFRRAHLFNADFLTGCWIFFLTVKAAHAKSVDTRKGERWRLNFSYTAFSELRWGSRSFVSFFVPAMQWLLAPRFRGLGSVLHIFGRDVLANSWTFRPLASVYHSRWFALFFWAVLLFGDDFLLETTLARRRVALRDDLGGVRLGGYELS